MQRRKRSTGRLVKTVGLLFFVGLLIADGFVAFFLIRQRFDLLFPAKPALYFPLINKESPLGDPGLLPSQPSSTATETPPPAAKTYIVQSGDTLSQIANDHGISVEELVNANHLGDKNVIKAGDELTIPPSSGATVTPGTTPTSTPTP